MAGKSKSSQERKAAYAALRAAGYDRAYARSHDRAKGDTLAKLVSRGPSTPNTRSERYSYLRGLGLSREEARRADKASAAEIRRIAADARAGGGGTAAREHRARQSRQELPGWYHETSKKMSAALRRAHRAMGDGPVYDALKVQVARIREILQVKARQGPSGPSLADYHYINDETSFWADWLPDEDWSDLYGSEEDDEA
jgi:hypothetical protein